MKKLLNLLINGHVLDGNQAQELLLKITSPENKRKSDCCSNYLYDDARC